MRIVIYSVPPVRIIARMFAHNGDLRDRYYVKYNARGIGKVAHKRARTSVVDTTLNAVVFRYNTRDFVYVH